MTNEERLRRRLARMSIVATALKESADTIAGHVPDKDKHRALLKIIADCRADDLRMCATWIERVLAGEYDDDVALRRAIEKQVMS